MMGSAPMHSFLRVFEPVSCKHVYISMRNVNILIFYLSLRHFLMQLISLIVSFPLPQMAVTTGRYNRPLNLPAW